MCFNKQLDEVSFYQPCLLSATGAAFYCYLVPGYICSNLNNQLNMKKPSSAKVRVTKHEKMQILKEKNEEALAGGRKTRFAAYHAMVKLTARERFDLLMD